LGTIHTLPQTIKGKWLPAVFVLASANVRKARWLLTSPDDQLYLKAIINVYPDALIIHTHRHPAEAIPSVGSLTYTVRRVFADPMAVAE